MIKMLTQWRESKNLLKYLLILFIVLIAFIEGTRLFIHNITTRLGWWMFCSGSIAASIFFIYNSRYNMEVINRINDYIDLIIDFIRGIL